MRRKIALLLCMLLIFNIMPVKMTYAASGVNFSELRGEVIISENGEKLEVDESIDLSKQEKASLQWSISESGKYELTYYTDTNTVSGYRGTTTVKVGFDVDFNKIDYNIMAFKSARDGSEKIPVDDGVGTIQKENPGTSCYIKCHAGNLNIYINVDVNKKIVQLTTNGISKGNFTPFVMNYEGNKECIGILRGIEGLSITPTHYRKDAIDLTKDSKKTLTVTNEEETDIPGNRPGIKIEFQVPNVINETTGEFEPIKDRSVTASFNLFPQLESNASSNSTSDNAQFDIKLGDVGKTNVDFFGSLKEENAVGSKVATIEERDGKHYATVYLSQTDEDFENSGVGGVKEQIIRWSKLKESMFIAGQITLIGLLSGKYKNGSDDLDNPIGINDTFAPGATYLKYKPTKTEEGKVTLDITPYKYINQKLFYKVYQTNTSAIDLTKPFGTFSYVYTKQNENDTLAITVPGDGKNQFLIEVGFADVDLQTMTFESQKVIYDTTGMVSSPVASEITNVEDIYVIPKEDKKVIDAAGFNMQWSIPNRDELANTLQKGDLYYEISISDRKDTKEDERKLIAVLKYTKDDAKPNLYVGRHRATLEINDLVDIEEGKNNKSKGTITLKGVVLKEILQNAKILLPPENYVEGEEYPESSEFKVIDAEDYHIPRTYYLRVRTILEPKSGKLKTNLYDSEPYAIALDTVTKPIPVPSGFNSKIEENSLVNYIIGFNNVSLEEYSYYEIEPRKQELISDKSISSKNLPRTFEVYLRQNTYITNNSSVVEGGLSEDDIKKQDNIYECTNILTTQDNEIVLDDTILSQLRNGKIVKLKFHTKEDYNKKGNELEFKLKNLDPNQTYNLRVRTTLEVKKVDNTTEIRVSQLSKTIGFTTGTQVKPPTSDEMQLPVPKDYVATAEGSTTAILNWDDPEMSMDKVLTYEIVRVTEKMLDKDVVSQGVKQKLDEFISSSGRSDAVKFNADSTNRVIKKDEESGQERLIYELKDDTVSPNTIYYYYIRTVCEGSYSQWIYQPVTTKNIDKPEELKAISSTKNSINISFLAKVPLDTVPNTYDFEILIQEDSDGEWQVVSNKSKLKETREDIKEGYSYFEYQIGDLKPNRRYNIKVCLIDKSSGQELKSLYSNIVFTRTAFDEAEQEKEDKYQDYLDKFDNEVEKLRSQSYWVVKEGEAYKYKADYLNSEMGVNKEYTLFSEKNDTEAYYYLPISSIEKCNEEQILLQVQLGDQSIAIRPNTITLDNEVIREVQNDISVGRIKDYYIGLHVSKSNFSQKINNQDPLSPKITIDLEIIYLNQEDWLIEKEILEEFEKTVEVQRKRFEENLERNINKKYISDSDLKGVIENAMNDIKRLHEKQVSRLLNKHNRNQKVVNQLGKSLLISLINSENYMVDGFYLSSGQWKNVQTYSTGDSAYIEATQLGSYIFVGQKSLLNTVPSVAPYQKFISQYGLTEFFTFDNYMIQTAVTKEQVYGSLARVMGATQGTDYVVFLSSQGIQGVSKLTKGNLVRQDEAVYLIMQGYEKIKHKPVESIQIQNYQSVRNIGAFQPKYRPYVYVAVQLKIIDNPNSMVLPSKQMSVEEYIKALYLMAQK